MPTDIKMDQLDLSRDTALISNASVLTAENERLRKALEKYAQDKTCRGDLARIALGMPVTPDGGHIPTTIERLRDAILAEREACAKIADAKAEEYDGDDYPPPASACWAVAAAIRARTGGVDDAR